MFRQKYRFTFLGLIIGVTYAILYILFLLIDNDIVLEGNLSNPLTIVMLPLIIIGSFPASYIADNYTDCKDLMCLDVIAFLTPILGIVAFVLLGLVVDSIITGIKITKHNAHQKD